MAMARGSFHESFFTTAWPTGEFGGMGLEGAVKAGFRRELEAIEDPEKRQALFDELLATPDVAEPYRLIKPEAVYLFADEELEELSAGQKILLRMGSANAARVKARLSEFRQALD